MHAIAFDPQLPLWLIATLAGISLAVLAVAVWYRLAGWWLRALAAIVLLIALAQPSWRQEDRLPVPGIALVVLDESASNRIADRPDQLAAARLQLR